MDPKKFNSLDPKLKEAYERVMGTPMSQPQATEASSSTSQSTPEQPAPSSPQPAAAEPPPSAPAATIKDAKPQVHEEHAIANQTGGISGGFIAGGQKSGPKISSKILFLAAIAFFLVYALFWVRFFNLQRPFFPQ